jgi:hypothetical protein
MKKILLLVTILFVGLTSFAQNKITGFGKLQLGALVSEIPELTNAKPVTEKEFFSKVYENRGTGIYESIYDSTSKYPSFGSLDKRVRVFQLGTLQITESVTLHDITLKFFNDKLYSVDIKDRQLDDLLTTKYGTPKEEIETKDHTFQNGYGATFVKTDITKRHNWETGDINIICYYTDLYWYNDKGKLNGINYAILHNKTISTLVGTEEKNVIARIDKREEDKKKSLVSGF